MRMLHWIRRTVAGQLTGLVTILVIVIAGFIAVYFPARTATGAEQALREQSEAIGRMTATRLAPALVFGDKAEAQQALASAAQTPDFISAAVFETGGTTALAGIQPTQRGIENSFTLIIPVTREGQRLGTLHLHFSRERVRLTVARQRRDVLIISGVLVIFGVIAALAIGGAISKPLRDLAQVADRIASGDLTSRAHAESTEEGERLVGAFNTMLDQVQVAQASLAHVNADLEARVEERTRDLRHTTRQLGIERDRAEEASRSKSRFLATMSHEIRTPLNGILGMAGLLIDSPLTASQRDCAETLRSSGDALLTIIDDILDFSKIEAGKMDLECIEYDLYPILEEVIDLVGVRVTERGLDLALTVEADAPRRLFGDPGRVRQVLLNLLGNAVKFTAQGEVLLHVRPAGPDLVRIEVKDSGIGLDEESRQRLFQPFVQADGSTTRRFGGTGLGLAICRQLVELMGGTIDVDSAPGVGSTFWFTLPAPMEQAPAHVPPQSDWHVLIVDDHGPTAGMASAALAPAGIRTTHRYDALRAAELLDAKGETRPTLILLDDHLAGADELAARAKAGGVPVLWLSARGHAGTRLPKVPKPLRSTVLLRGIQQVVGGTTTTPLDADDADEPSTTTNARRLLLVEDNSVNQKVARMILERMGWRVDVAGDGTEAVKAVGSLPYDIVLMDCQMPVMDGFEATKVIRAREAEGGEHRIPIIALTANAMRGDREACLAAGMDDFVSKPIQPERLAEVLRQWTGGGGRPATVEAPVAVSPGEPAVEEFMNADALEALREVERESGMAILQDIVGEYLQQLGPRLATIEAGAAARDWALVAREAHSLKGSSGSLGATALFRASAEMEQHAKEGDAGAVQRALPGLQALGERTKQHLERELASNAAAGASA